MKVGQSPGPPCRQVPSEELQLAAIAQQLVQLPRSERISRLEVLVSSWKSQDDSFCLPKAVEVNVREKPAKKTKAVAEPAREKPPLKKRRNYYLQAMRSLGVKTTWSTGQGGSGRLGFVLSEPFNREAVERFGSLRAAAQLGFRQALAALLVRGTEAAGVVKVAYRECHTVANLFDVETLGRAYGGYVAKHYEELAKRLKKIDPVKGQDDVDAISAQMGIYMQLPPVFGNLQKLGMSSFAASNSAFSFSRALKDRTCLLERFLSPWMGERFFSSAVPGGSCWGDARAPPGLDFVRNRDSYLDMLPVERENAKEFFTGLLFGSGSGRCRESEDQHGVRLPQCVQDLIAELRALRDIDEKKYKNQMRMLATEYLCRPSSPAPFALQWRPRGWAGPLVGNMTELCLLP